MQQEVDDRVCFCTPDERAFLDSLWDQTACDGVTVDGEPYIVTEDDGQPD